MRELTLEQALDTLMGCAVLGCGGGGGLQGGPGEVRRAYAEGFKVVVCELDELPPNALVASPYLCGSVCSESTLADGAPHAGLVVMMDAFRSLEDYLKEPFFGVYATELGAGNTGYAMAVAARCHLPILDGDPAGRAVPELIHSTMYIKGIGMCPFSISTRRGDSLVVAQVSSDAVSEIVARAMAVSAGGAAAVCDHPLRGQVARDALIAGTLSLSEKIGYARRCAAEHGEDPAAAVAATAGGQVLFRGRIAHEPAWRDEGGFTYGEINLLGEFDWQGQKACVQVRNENVSLEINACIVATVPDLISLMQLPEGLPLLNPNIPSDTSVAVLAFPAPDIWRTATGLEIFGPRWLGLDIPYRPVESTFS